MARTPGRGPTRSSRGVARFSATSSLSASCICRAVSGRLHSPAAFNPHSRGRRRPLRSIPPHCDRGYRSADAQNATRLLRARNGHDRRLCGLRSRPEVRVISWMYQRPVNRLSPDPSVGEEKLQKPKRGLLNYERNAVHDLSPEPDDGFASFFAPIPSAPIHHRDSTWLPRPRHPAG